VAHGQHAGRHEPAYVYLAAGWLLREPSSGLTTASTGYHCFMRTILIILVVLVVAFLVYKFVIAKRH